MPINASPHFLKAEQEYLHAQTTKDKIKCLKKMISLMPSHKGAEKLRKNLKKRLVRLKYAGEKEAKKKTGKKGIRKAGFQCVFVGLPNSGKSSLLSKLTNAQPKISLYPFTTASPEIGTMLYGGIKAQIIDIPSIGSENFDYSLVNSADCLLITVQFLKNLEKISPHIKKSHAKQIIILNKSDFLSKEEKRKLQETIKSRKLNAVITSCQTEEGISELKQKILESMNVIRIYTKEPGKPPSKDPITLHVGSRIKDAAESIRKNFSNQVKFTTLTGPSGKFPNQKVGLSHILKDKDIVEFHTK